MPPETGMPVPKLISCGEHPSSLYSVLSTFSILMARLPGFPLENSSDPFEVDEEGPWVNELKASLHTMRQWQSLFGDERICSVMGTSIRSSRVPGHEMGPFEKRSSPHWIPSGSSFRSWVYFRR